MTDSGGIVHHTGYDGNVFSTVEDQIELLRGRATTLEAEFTALGLAPQRNYLDNSSFVIVQRGTGTWATGSATYTVDRWAATRTGTAGATISRQTGASGVRYKMRVQRNNTNASTVAIAFYQALESARSAELAGRQVTLSFYVTAGTSYSAASGALASKITYGTGADQAMSGAPAASWTGATADSQSNTITTTRTKFTQTVTVPSNANQVGVSFIMTPVGTASTANDYFEIDSPKLELGSGASLWTPRSDAEEFSACAMFYEDLGYDAFTGASTLRAFNGSANTNAAGIQYFWASIILKTKRYAAHSLTLGEIPSTDGWHITMAGAGSYYGLGANDVIVQVWSHKSVESGLFQFYYAIDGSHPTFTNGVAGLFALDGAGAHSSFAVSCDLAA